MSTRHAHVDPEQLREFSNALDVFASKVASHDSAMTTALVRLGDSFKDDDYERFRARFISSRQLLQRFVEEAKKQVPRLRDDADKIVAAQSVNL
jgi:hypothetical protein